MKPHMSHEWIAGDHAVAHALAAGRRKIFTLYLKKGSEREHAPLLDMARRSGISVQSTDAGFFAKNFPSTAHHGIAAQAGPYPYVDFGELLGEKCLLVLDQIQDPQNLGAICRSAYFFGVGGVILPKDNAASVTVGACQASVGAVEYLKIARSPSLPNRLEDLKEAGFWIYGLDAKAEKSFAQEQFPEKTALVVGNEEKGMGRLIRERCDLLLRIPGSKEGQKIDSLNASVSAAVAIYEVFRGRG